MMELLTRELIIVFFESAGVNTREKPQRFISAVKLRFETFETGAQRINLFIPLMK